MMVDLRQQVAPADSGTAPGPFPDSSLEGSFQSVRQALQTAAPARSSGLILLVTLALFVFAQLGSNQTVVSIAVLVAVLLFHELGHLAGMKLFGYRDVKMFFIPFFGAAVSGKRRGVAGWKEATVLLLGPLPGIALGLFLAIWQLGRPSPLLYSLTMALVLINAFNLLPVSPLDGGRFFHLLLFCRHRLLEFAFASLAGLVLIASFVFGFYLLPIVGIFVLVALPRQWRLRRAAESLRAQFADWGGEPAQLAEPQLRAAFLAVRTVNAGAPLRNPRGGADAIEQVLERVSLRVPSILASVLLVLPWAAGLVASFFALVVLSMAGPPVWKLTDVPRGGFSILLPRRVPVSEVERDTPFGKLSMQSLDAPATGGFFTARWYDFPSGKKPEGEQARATFFDVSRDKLLERAKASLVEEAPLPDGRVIRIREENGRISIAHVKVVGNRVYLLFALAEPADEAQRFFDSFRLLSPAVEVGAKR
jgi:Zn-dependent protease